MIDFKDKKILITGATGGIGHALVKKFVSLNANVLGTGTKTEKLDSLKNEFPNINIIHTKPVEAEMVKYVANTFLATKVSFANEMKIICDKLDIDFSCVRRS